MHLLYPIVDGDVLIAPFKLEYVIADGALPAGAKVAAPGSYEFRIQDYAEARVWSFQVAVFANSGSSISIAELWLLSRLDQDDPTGIDLENVDAALLGSNGAPYGFVLTADGNGATFWGVSGGGDVLGQYLRGDVDDTGVMVYLGYTKTSPETSWVIKRMEFIGDEIEERYVTGTTDYTGSWTVRDTLIYQLAEDVEVY